MAKYLFIYRESTEGRAKPSSEEMQASAEAWQKRIAPSPLHSLGRAVAEAYLHGPQAGLERLASVPPESVPARYPGWHAVIGELHFRLGRHAAAERAWRKALRLTSARADREFLRRRLAVCRPDGGEPANRLG